MKGVVILTAVLLTTHIAHAQATSAPDTQAFALGLALQTPTARSQSFLEDVRELRGSDESDVPAQVDKLAADARALRASELAAYSEAGRLLTSLHAPPDLTEWADGTIRLLSAPIITSTDADIGKDSPGTVLILSAIDEAQVVKLNADRETASVQTWLKLTRGGAGVWACTLGRIAAGMTVSAQTGRPFLLPRAGILHLHDTSPPGTPHSVVQTLGLLAPRGRGNLSRFVSPLSQVVPARTVKLPAQNIVTAFGADDLTRHL